MEAKDIEVVTKECESYFEELENTYPNIVLETFDIDTLTLAAMFRQHPSSVGTINKEVIDKVSSDELYSVFREQVLEKAKRENWNFALATEKMKNESKVGVPRNMVYNPNLIIEMTEKNKELRRQIELLRNPSPEVEYYKEAMRLNYKYKKVAEDFIKAWYAFINYKKNKKNKQK